MDEQQVLALIENALKDNNVSIMEQVNKANQGLAANLTKEIKKVTQPSTQEPVNEDEAQRVTVKSLQLKLKELEEGLAKEKEQVYRSQRDAAVSNLISNEKVINASALKKLFLLERESKIKQVENEWYVEEGDSVTPLSDAFKQYLSSDEGSVFVAPSAVQGTGSKEIKGRIPQSDKPLTLDDALANFQL